MRLRRVSLTGLALLLAVPAGGAAAPAPAMAVDAINAMMRAAGGDLVAHVAPETGAYDFIDATESSVVAADDLKKAPEARAFAFLRRYGAAVGMRENERRSVEQVLRVREVYQDPAGNSHVRLDQMYRGKSVFAGSLVVHMNERGITGVNGIYVPKIAVPSRAQVTSSRARLAALNAVAKAYSTTKLQAVSAGLTVYRSGLVEGRRGTNRLAYEIVVSGAGIRDRVMIDAAKGIVLLRMPMIHDALDRVVYSPQYNPDNPDLFALRKEGSSPTLVPPVDNLYEFSGQVYDLYSSAFGRDSFDGKGRTMRTVYLVNDVCPNAYWNSSTTNYCPGLDLDDVVAHEWAHAYTEYTHGLLYMCEPGALNEAYSDIFGETVDLLNNMDGIGGSNNDEPYPNGQRWLVGEDLTAPVMEALGLRDMWDPQRIGAPAKVSDPEFHCDIASDGGGVHTNSGIANHAYAMIVDGKTFNDRTIRGIGFTKALHIYYQAMAAYQTSTTQFETHALSLAASCGDLAGVNLKALFTGAPSGERINASDCAQVVNATLATEMFKTPTQCAFEPLLSKEIQPICPAAQVFLNETWENGSDGWTFGNEGVTQDWPNLDWKVRSGLPQRKGHAAFAVEPAGGVCLESRGSYAGLFWMESPEATIGAGANDLTLRFDHNIATESFDGGNVLVSVNGSEFTLLDTYTFNGPNGVLPPPFPPIPAAAGGGNTNPKADQAAWHLANPGTVSGSWATTIADLSEVAQPGDKVKLRFEFGIDACGGVEGWYVDDIAIYACPELPLPDLSISGAGNPDPDRSVGLSWNRPAGGIGPDEVQRSTLGDQLLINDDAESGTDGWTITTNGVGILGWRTSTQKSNSGSTSFAARAVDPLIAGDSILEWGAPIRLPAGGETILRWFDWYAGEGDDSAIVEVHDGKDWVVVKKKTNALQADESLMGWLNDPFTAQKIDLSKFAGKTVKLRFRYAVGAENRVLSTALFGWHVDDISLTTAHWETLSRPAAITARLSNLADGKHFFRVRTFYRTGFGTITPGPWSKPVSAQVKGKLPVVRGAKSTRRLPATGVGTPLVAFALLGGAVLTLRAVRRARA